jgi:acetyl-CoA acyltransferase
MYNSVIAGFARSPFTMANKGALINTKPVNLLSEIIKKLIINSKINPSKIEDVIVGCAFQVGEQCFNIGRLATLMSNLDVKIPGMTIDRWCGSSMEAIHIAAGKISMGSGKVFICAGVESMTRVKTGFDSLPYPFTEDQNNNPHLYLSMGITAENVAKKYNISRQEQQEFAIKSHEKAYMAQKNGKFNNEIIKIDNCKIDEILDPTVRWKN